MAQKKSFRAFSGIKMVVFTWRFDWDEKNFRKKKCAKKKVESFLIRQFVHLVFSEKKFPPVLPTCQTLCLLCLCGNADVPITYKLQGAVEKSTKSMVGKHYNMVFLVSMVKFRPALKHNKIKQSLIDGYLYQHKIEY